MVNMLENIKNKITQGWQWLKDNPKKAYQYMLGILILSAVFFVFEVFFLENKMINSQPVPTLFGTSDKYINEKNEKIALRKAKMENILKELETLKYKEVLLKSDSVRIEYLLNQYSELKNEKE